MNASIASPGLSKSRFMAGLQCHKRLYLETYRPQLTGPADESGSATFERGHAVGALARNRYPGGTLIGENLIGLMQNARHKTCYGIAHYPRFSNQRLASIAYESGPTI